MYNNFLSMFHVCLRQYFQGGWFIRGITGLDESEWVGRRAELLTLDYNFGGTSRSGIDVPRIVGSENRLSCMIYDVSRRGYDRSYPRNAKWRVRLPQVAIRQLKISRFRIVVVSGGASVRFGVLSCLTRAKDRWILWRRIDARGCIELCVVVTIPPPF